MDRRTSDRRVIAYKIHMVGYIAFTGRFTINTFMQIARTGQDQRKLNKSRKICV